MRKFTFLALFIMLTYSLTAQGPNFSLELEPDLTVQRGSEPMQIQAFPIDITPGDSRIAYFKNETQDADELQTAVDFKPETINSFPYIKQLEPVTVSDPTKEKPQAKTWKYAGKWWAVLATSGGMKLFRLDSTTWTDVHLVSPHTLSRADCRVVGNVVHIILYKGTADETELASLQYDEILKTYKPWSQRPTNVNLKLATSSETATVIVDTRGRMWIASDAASRIMVVWSDAPYTNWSEPIQIAKNVKDIDICAITAIPSQRKIGILWSDQTTKRFGFKTHDDGTDPAIWSADEIPASQSALDIKSGMADDHMNMVVSSNGTVYCAVKTGYNTPDLPQLALLIRRPSGQWDDLHPVTIGEGTQPFIILNEAKNRISVVYSSQTNGGDILCRGSSLSNISFGAPSTIMSGGGNSYNYTTSTHQSIDPEVAILATNMSTSPHQVVSVLASDEPFPGQLTMPGFTKEWILAQPNPFPGITYITFTLAEASEYTLSLYDITGAKVATLKKGFAEARATNAVRVDLSALSNGIYITKLLTQRGTILSLKMILRR